MNNLNQRGATMWTTLSVLFMIGLIVYLGAIVGNVYLDHKFIKASMQEVVNQSNFKTMSKKEVLSTINKRLTIDNIRGLDKDTISIHQERTGERYIKIIYSVKSNVASNINILIEFDEEIRTVR